MEAGDFLRFGAAPPIIFLTGARTVSILGTTMARQSTFPLYDRLLNGRLALILREARAHGQSFERIAETLRNEYGVSVTTSTVQRWIAALPADREPAA